MCFFLQEVQVCSCLVRDRLVEIKGHLQSLCHNALLTHHLKHSEVHPSFWPFSFHPNLWRTKGVSSGFGISTTALCNRSSHVVEVATEGGSWLKSKQERTLLQDLLQDPSVNAIGDVPKVQYDNSGFST